MGKYGQGLRERVEGFQACAQTATDNRHFRSLGVAMIGEGIIVVILAAYVKHVMHGNALGWVG